MTHPSRSRPSAFRPRFVMVGALVLFAVAVALFLELADGDYLELEKKAVAWFREPGDPSDGRGPGWLEYIAIDLTALGGIPVAILLTLVVSGYLFVIRRFGVAVFLLVVVGGGLALNLYLKSIFARERPDLVPHLTMVSTSAFPSGHAMLSAVLYLTIGAVLMTTASRNRERIYFLATAILVTFLVGFTRVYLGVHYPSDVIAGWAAGSAWALLCGGVALWWERKRRARRRASDKESA